MYGTLFTAVKLPNALRSDVFAGVMQYQRETASRCSRLPSKFDDMALPKPRKKPFTERERDVLFSLLKKYADTVENRRTDSITLLQKRRVWNKVTTEYNRSRDVTRESTMKQLMKAWKNWKTKERNFRLADFSPRTPLSDPLESEEEEDDTDIFLCSRLSRLNDNVVTEWDSEKSPLEDTDIDIDFVKTDGDSETVQDDTTMHETISNQHSLSTIVLNNPCLNNAETVLQNFDINGDQFSKELQKEQHKQLSHSLGHECSETAAAGITTIAGVYSQAGEQSTSSHVFKTRQESTQSFSQPEKKKTLGMNLNIEEQLNDLKIQIACAQLKKVKAEAEGQTLLLKEQLRKAKAEADLAELLLERHRCDRTDS